MAKKKKMTKAQAASARREVTPQMTAKAKAQEDNKIMREQRRIAQKKANDTTMFRFLVPLMVIVVIIVFSLVFTIGPGLFMGG